MRNQYGTLFAYSPEQQKRLKNLQDEKERALSKYATHSLDATRERPHRYERGLNEELIRNEFVVDVGKIIHGPFYNRAHDKTQVFSFQQNDDLTRRALHLQLVSHIARTIGTALSLNVDLIEAIALGHDAGHTPFGHHGERVLDEIYFKKAQRHFCHSVHSVRIFRKITDSNLTLETLDGILTHDGEKELYHYEPARPHKGFVSFDEAVESCYLDKSAIKKMCPTTLEGCVVRLSDIIAYVGKDRQDASKSGLRKMNAYGEPGPLGNKNREIISRVMANVVKNSLGKPYLALSDEVYADLSRLKNQNYDLIYLNPKISAKLEKYATPIIRDVYERLLLDLANNNEESPIFRHHLNHPLLGKYRQSLLRDDCHNEIVCDFVASMTDDYIIDLNNYLFPERAVERSTFFVSYFA